MEKPNRALEVKDEYERLKAMEYLRPIIKDLARQALLETIGKVIQNPSK